MMSAQAADFQQLQQGYQSNIGDEQQHDSMEEEHGQASLVIQYYTSSHHDKHINMSGASYYTKSHILSISIIT